MVLPHNIRAKSTDSSKLARVKPALPLERVDSDVFLAGGHDAVADERRLCHLGILLGVHHRRRQSNRTLPVEVQTGEVVRHHLVLVRLDVLAVVGKALVLDHLRRADVGLLRQEVELHAQRVNDVGVHHTPQPRRIPDRDDLRLAGLGRQRSLDAHSAQVRVAQHQEEGHLRRHLELLQSILHSQHLLAHDERNLSLGSTLAEEHNLLRRLVAVLLLVAQHTLHERVAQLPCDGSAGVHQRRRRLVAAQRAVVAARQRHHALALATTASLSSVARGKTHHHRVGVVAACLLPHKVAHLRVHLGRHVVGHRLVLRSTEGVRPHDLARRAQLVTLVLDCVVRVVVLRLRPDEVDVRLVAVLRCHSHHVRLRERPDFVLLELDVHSVCEVLKGVAEHPRVLVPRSPAVLRHDHQDLLAGPLRLDAPRSRVRVRRTPVDVEPPRLASLRESLRLLDLRLRQRATGHLQETRQRRASPGHGNRLEGLQNRHGHFLDLLEAGARLHSAVLRHPLPDVRPVDLGHNASKLEHTRQVVLLHRNRLSVLLPQAVVEQHRLTAGHLDSVLLLEVLLQRLVVELRNRGRLAHALLHSIDAHCTLLLVLAVVRRQADRVRHLELQRLPVLLVVETQLVEDRLPRHDLVHNVDLNRKPGTRVHRLQREVHARHDFEVRHARKLALVLHPEVRAVHLLHALVAVKHAPHELREHSHQLRADGRGGHLAREFHVNLEDAAGVGDKRLQALVGRLPLQVLGSRRDVLRRKDNIACHDDSQTHSAHRLQSLLDCLCMQLAAPDGRRQLHIVLMNHRVVLEGKLHQVGHDFLPGSLRAGLGVRDLRQRLLHILARLLGLLP
eukprot:Rhum_TRINITY_DN10810_c0_g1::Rhum_TRINITY_DN10810_c0_g1_i1::g.40566::m.40566